MENVHERVSGTRCQTKLLIVEHRLIYAETRVELSFSRTRTYTHTELTQQSPFSDLSLCLYRLDPIPSLSIPASVCMYESDYVCLVMPEFIVFSMFWHF